MSSPGRRVLRGAGLEIGCETCRKRTRLQDLADDVAPNMCLTLHLWRADLICGVVEVDKFNIIQKTTCCALHQAGAPRPALARAWLLFACRDVAAMLHTPLRTPRLSGFCRCTCMLCSLMRAMGLETCVCVTCWRGLPQPLPGVPTARQAYVVPPERRLSGVAVPSLTTLLPAPPPAGMLFGLGNSSLMKRFLGDLVQVPNRVSELLRGKDKKKGALKMGSTGQVRRPAHAPACTLYKLRHVSARWRVSFQPGGAQPHCTSNLAHHGLVTAAVVVASNCSPSRPLRRWATR